MRISNSTEGSSWPQRCGVRIPPHAGCLDTEHDHVAAIVPAPLVWPTLDGRKALLDGVDKVPALTNRVTSGGRLNVAKSLAKLLGKPEPTAPPAPACEKAMLSLPGKQPQLLAGSPVKISRILRVWSLAPLQHTG